MKNLSLLSLPIVMVSACGGAGPEEELRQPSAMPASPSVPERVAQQTEPLRLMPAFRPDGVGCRGQANASQVQSLTLALAGGPEGGRVELMEVLAPYGFPLVEGVCPFVMVTRIIDQEVVDPSVVALRWEADAFEVRPAAPGRTEIRVVAEVIDIRPIEGPAPAMSAEDVEACGGFYDNPEIVLRYTLEVTVREHFDTND